MSGPFVQLPPLRKRRVVLATLLVLAIALSFWLLYRFRTVLLVLFVALVISTAMKPVVDNLNRRGISRPVGIVAVYLVLLLALLLFLVLGAPLMLEQSTRIVRAIPDGYQELRSALLNQPNLLLRRLAIELPLELRTPGTPAEANGAETIIALQQLWQMLGRASLTVLNVLATFILAFYWTLEGDRLKRTLLLFVPPNRREGARLLISEIEDALGRYTAGLAILIIFVGVLSLAAYLLIGLRYALVLAVVAGLFEAVPIIGPMLGAIPAVIVALSQDPIKALWVIVAALAIQQIENSFLFPRVMSRSVGVNPLVTLLAFVAFGYLFGPAGAFVAIPLAAIVQLLLNRYLLEPETLLELDDVQGRDQLSVLRYQTQQLMRDMRKRVRGDTAQANAEPEIEEQLETIATELETLLAVSVGDRQGDAS